LVGKGLSSRPGRWIGSPPGCAVPAGGRGSTVRVADREPGEELQVDFGRMGLVYDDFLFR